MAALHNKIIVGNYDFENDDIISLPTNESVSLLGDELSYDTFEPSVKFEKSVTGPEIFQPKKEEQLSPCIAFNGNNQYYLAPDSEDDSSWYDGLETDDDYIFSGWYTGREGDLRTLPYGTIVRHYHNNDLIGKFYLNKVVRNSANEYELQCISSIGLLDRQNHKGNIYRDITFATVLSEIMHGSNITYNVSNELNSLKIFGWLPYDTSRNNLQRLLFATNVHIDKDVNGDPVFKYLSINQSNINDVKVYNDGKEEYPELASKAIITEHSFFFTGMEEEIELFNNSSDAYVNNLEVIFSDAPIYVSSIRQEGNITFVTKSANYAVINGNGIIYGKPYTHSKFNIIRTAIVGNEEKEVSVSDDCLITVANSENVADRVMAYYSSQVKIEAGIVYNGEKCGNKYSFNDAFREYNIGFLTKMKKIVSSFIKAECEFITGYEPIQNGNNYSTCIRLTGSGTWSIPSGVSKIRVVLIGGGDGGSSGTAGTNGGSEYDGRGGIGGKAGTPGNGGKINVVVINNPSSSYSYNCGAGGNGAGNCSSTETPISGYSGGNTTFGSYSSANGNPSNTGFADTFNGNIYGMIGDPGCDGGDGGDGGSNTNGENAQEERLGKVGSDIEFNGVTYKGGSASQGDLCKWSWIEHTEGIGGGGASGAVYGHNGNAGSNGSYALNYMAQDWDPTWKIYLSRYEWYDLYSGNGGNAPTPSKPSTPSIYGKGGAAGCGGGGGGAAGDAGDWSDYSYKSNLLNQDGFSFTLDTIIHYKVEHCVIGSNGYGSYGGAGGDGADGCILVYY